MAMNESLVKTVASNQKAACVSSIMSHSNLAGLDAESQTQVQAMYDHIVQKIIDAVLHPMIDETFNQIRAATITCPTGTGTII